MKKSFLLFTILSFQLFLYAFAGEKNGRPALAVAQLKCSFSTNPMGIDNPHPLLSWISTTANRGQKQTAWQIQVASDPALLSANKPDVWNSSKTNSSNSNNIVYAGAALQSGRKYYWRVKVWDKNNQPSDWSQSSYWIMGLLQSNDWKGEWIKDSKEMKIADSLLYNDHPSPIFRRTIAVDKKIKSAVLFISGLGYYEAFINGKKVGNHLLDPGQTDYSKRVLYSTYDVTDQLEQQNNCIGIMLGNGWYNPLPLQLWGGLNLRKSLTIGQPSFILQLNILYEDGTTSYIASDKNWSATDGPVIRNSVYLGEHYDATKEPAGWNTPGFIESAWRKVGIDKGPAGKMQAQQQPPIVAKEILTPISITPKKEGKYIVDFGRNFGGIIRLKVNAAAGTVIKVKYGELLYADSSLNVMTSVAGQIKGKGVGGPGAPEIAYQTDQFVASGRGVEFFQPRFTYHGFRYAEISGYPGDLQKQDISGLVLHADVADAGNFSCSDPMINNIQLVCRNTFLSNIFSVQSDCPHREKFGYGGDILASSESFMNNFDMANFYTKVVYDHADAARTDGGLTETAPYVGIADQGLGNGSGPIEWGTGHPELLYRLYQYYGNISLVKDQYAVAKKWVDYVSSKAKNNIIDVTLGDHETLVDKDIPVSGTSFYYYNVHLLSQMAKWLGNKADEKKYTALANEIRNTFINQFIDANTGYAGKHTQATQSHALYFNLVPAAAKDKVVNVLVNNIQNEHKGHLSTGMFGTKFVTEVLSQNGKADVAYQLVTKPGYPGWVNMIEKGATTLWEHWDFSDNTFSHNHPMFGSVSEWFYRHLAGIRPANDAVGFNKIIIQPQVTSLQYASGSYQSVLGVVSSKWKLENGKFILEVSIPVNASAEIYLPAKKMTQVTEGGKPVVAVNGIKKMTEKDEQVVISTGSGTYTFTVNMK